MRTISFETQSYIYTYQCCRCHESLFDHLSTDMSAEEVRTIQPTLNDIRMLNCGHMVHAFCCVDRPRRNQFLNYCKFCKSTRPNAVQKLHFSRGFECPICLDVIRELNRDFSYDTLSTTDYSPNLTAFKCGHVFHLDCVQEMRRIECPLCRSEYPTTARPNEKRMLLPPRQPRQRTVRRQLSYESSSSNEMSSNSNNTASSSALLFDDENSGFSPCYSPVFDMSTATTTRRHRRRRRCNRSPPRYFLSENDDDDDDDDADEDIIPPSLSANTRRRRRRQQNIIDLVSSDDDDDMATAMDVEGEEDDAAANQQWIAQPPSTVAAATTAAAANGVQPQVIVRLQRIPIDNDQMVMLRREINSDDEEHQEEQPEQHEDNPSQQEEQPEQPENIPPQPENIPPQQENIPPQPENIPPQPDPQQEDIPPQPQFEQPPQFEGQYYSQHQGGIPPQYIPPHFDQQEQQYIPPPPYEYMPQYQDFAAPPPMPHHYDFPPLPPPLPPPPQQQQQYEFSEPTDLRWQPSSSQQQQQHEPTDLRWQPSTSSSPDIFPSSQEDFSPDIIPSSQQQQPPQSSYYYHPDEMEFEQQQPQPSTSSMSQPPPPSPPPPAPSNAKVVLELKKKLCKTNREFVGLRKVFQEHRTKYHSNRQYLKRCQLKMHQLRKEHKTRITELTNQLHNVTAQLEECQQRAANWESQYLMLQATHEVSTNLRITNAQLRDDLYQAMKNNYDNEYVKHQLDVAKAQLAAQLQLSDKLSQLRAKDAEFHGKIIVDLQTQLHESETKLERIILLNK